MEREKETEYESCLSTEAHDQKKKKNKEARNKQVHIITKKANDWLR